MPPEQEEHPANRTEAGAVRRNVEAVTQIANPRLLEPELDMRTRRRRRLNQVRWWSLVAIVLFVVLLGLLGPLLYSNSALEQSLPDRLLPPMSTTSETFYLLGTDALGRDVLARILAGLRISIFVAVMSVAVGVLIGCSLGLFSGYLGGRVDRVVTRLVDVQMSIPFLVFAMVLSAILGVGLVNTIIALGLTSWVVYARVARSETLSRRTLDYVDAARVMGAHPIRIVFRHLLPNSMNSLIVVATLEIGRVIIVEASLSFLGLGVQPPDPSLGGMVADGQAYVFDAWWLSGIPGLAIFVVVLAFVLFGDALRDRLDPKLR